jgi:hypothetical protein
MRALIVLLVTAALLPAQALTKQQKVERILNLTQATASIETVVAEVRKALAGQQPNPTAKQLEKREDALKKIEKLVRERLQKVRPELIRVYGDAFTDAELDGILAFYESPAGRAATQKLPAVNERLSGLMQTQIDAISTEINRLAEETLK